jgi:S-methylmethionine-dependent homocysteine/selenocysteine methylase
MPQASCGPAWLDAMLHGGDVVLLDGAIGTELEARGVPMHQKAWSGAAMAEHGDVIRRLHEDYIRAGARVITANTFSTGRHSLEPAGLGDHVTDVNRRAVALAREARDAAADAPVAVAGSVCEWVYDTTSRFVEMDALAESFHEQCHLLAEAGVDLIVLEMCQRLPDSALALKAARATGLPVWVGVSCRRVEGRPLQTFDTETQGDLAPLVAGLASLGPAAFTVMHTPVPDIEGGLEVVKRHWEGPTGAYPESGYFVMPNWQFVEIIDPVHLVDRARGWVAAGAQIIGGCCGLGPTHIRALKEGLGLTGRTAGRSRGPR